MVYCDTLSLSHLCVCVCVCLCACVRERERERRSYVGMWNDVIFMTVLVEVVWSPSPLENTTRSLIHTQTHHTCTYATPSSSSSSSSTVRWSSPDICICHSEGQYVSASVISKHFGVNKLLIFSISTDDNVASSWERGKMLSRGHSFDVNCVWQMVLSV